MEKMAVDSDARAAVAAADAAAAATQVNDLKNLVTTSFGALTQEISGIQVEVTEVKTTVKSQGKKLDKLADDYARLSAAMSKLDKQFDTNNSVEETLADIKDDVYERKPDLTVFRLNTPEPVDKDLVKPAFAKWFEDSNVDPANVTIEGQGQRFILRFNHADESTRVRAAVQAASTLRVDGVWRVFATHTGVTIYLDKDKNLRRQREAIIAKRILKLLPPKLKPYLDRRSDSFIGIRSNRELIAEVSCPQRDGSPVIEWDNEYAKDNNFNPVEIDVKALASAPASDKKLGRAQCL
jgi:hypothetical protein